MPVEGNNSGEGQMSYVMIYITAKDENEARSIGETLVKEKIAACVNIIPSVESIYWWKGSVENEKESVLLVKTREDFVGRVVKRVKELHSYDVPCVDVIPITGGNKNYLEWVDESLR